MKYILQNTREANYVNNEEFLRNIGNIKITYENLPGLENIPFCYEYVSLINQKKIIKVKNILYSLVNFN